MSLQWIFLARGLSGPGMIDEELFRFDLIRLFVREGILKTHIRYVCYGSSKFQVDAM